MALGATIHQIEVTVSDVDRSVYETLDLRLARHPSESMRYMLTRTFAYCLSYEDGIAFSKGGLSSNDEPPIAVRDPTGILLAWIDVGVPSAERLHKASKAARRVAIFTHADLALLRREAATKAIHKVDDIDVWRIDPKLLDRLEPKIDRRASVEIARNDGQLYVTIDGETIESSIERAGLATPA